MKKSSFIWMLAVLLLVIVPMAANFVFSNSVSAETDATDAPLDQQEICADTNVPAGWVITDITAQSFRCGVVYNPGNVYNVFLIEKISGYYNGTVVLMCNNRPFPNDWVVIERRAVDYRCGVFQQPPPPGGGQVVNIQFIRRVSGNPAPTPTPTPTPVPGRSPIGNFDGINQTTRVASGWTLDPDNPQASINVHFYIDGPAGNTQGSGTYIGMTNAGLYRPDVNTSTGYPGNHGFEFTISSQYCNGVNHPVYAYGIDSGQNPNAVLAGSPRTLNCSPQPAVRRTPFDFNGDGKADVTVVRNGGNWYSLFSPSSTFNATQFGSPGDIPVVGDYDGDGKSDIAVSRSESGIRYFYVLQSSNNQFVAMQWGLPVDVPVPGDYDGDGKTDYAVWRPGNGVGTWYINNSSTGQTTGGQFGYATDKPVPADYDGDGKTDIAVIRRTNGSLNWYVQRSALGFTGFPFGMDTDVAVPADYDGDGKSDAAVFRNGNWYIQRSALGFTGVSFGQSGDIPVQADYDGDGKADLSVFRGTDGNGNFYISNSTNSQISGGPFGFDTDVPIGGSYPR